MFPGFQIHLTPNKRPDTTRAKCALRVTHAENTSRVDSWHAGAGCAAIASADPARGCTLGDAQKDPGGVWPAPPSN